MASIHPGRRLGVGQHGVNIPEQEGQPMTAQEEETPAFSAVSKMEDAVTAARDYANLLMRLDDDTFENAEAACAVKRIAEHLRDHVDEIENLRGDLFRL